MVSRFLQQWKEEILSKILLLIWSMNIITMITNTIITMTMMNTANVDATIMNIITMITNTTITMTMKKVAVAVVMTMITITTMPTKCLKA